MRQVTATEAKSRLAQLLSAVEHGEVVAITRHGKTIAQLAPAHAQQRAARADAVARFRSQRSHWKKLGMSAEEIASARHEGHRY